MSYESAVVLVIIFSIPAGFLAITRLIRLRQQAESEKAELDLIFSSPKDDGSGVSL